VFVTDTEHFQAFGYALRCIEDLKGTIIEDSQLQKTPRLYASSTFSQVQ
jgi:hypothetical protein